MPSSSNSPTRSPSDAAPKPGAGTGPIRLRVTAAAENYVRNGHPWVYQDSIHEQSRPGVAGDLAVIYDRKNKFLAIGLYDPNSPLRWRALHRGKPVHLDPAWWDQHLETALQKRVPLFDDQTNGYRWIYGESDGWPGLVLDRYAGTLVLKLYSEIWFSRLEEVRERILRRLNPERLVLRLSRNIQTLAAERGLSDGQVLHGTQPDGPVHFLEHGICFESEVIRGQKTGFFLDQRDNRLWVGQNAAGRAVLNAFSFSGGFSLYAARGGASEVTDIDISPHAVAAASRNFALNQGNVQIQKCRHEAIQANVFDWLAEPSSRDFDLVILDPPSLAKRQADKPAAIQAYRHLARHGARRVRSGGLLMAASCSAHVTTEEFYAVVQESLTSLGTASRWTEVHRSGHAPDHAASFPEAQYLKCVVWRRP